jgi:amidase
MAMSRPELKGPEQRASFRPVDDADGLSHAAVNTLRGARPAMTDQTPETPQTATEMVAALASGATSAVRLAEEAIGRIERLDGPINAVVIRDFDRARVAAAEADAALARGERRPLLGLPMTVKESFKGAGLRTSWGVPAMNGWVADTDATAVARLKAAGAVILGKTNVALWLADWQSDNPVYGRVNNPLDLSRTAGGSSGGAAAAVASGMVPLELGSDIGGSIRVPAAFCGVYGHKSSYGLVPGRGHAPAGMDGASPVLGVYGPLARSAADLDLALGVIAGPADGEEVGYHLDLAAPRHDRHADYRVLVLDRHPAAETDAEIRAAVDALAGRIEAGGATVLRSSDLLPDLAAAHGVFATLLNTAISRGQRGGPPAISAHAWMDALDAQLRFRRQWAALFKAFDVVIAPTFGVVAFPHDDQSFGERIHRINGADTPYGAQIAWPGVALLPGLPATATPMGFNHDGLPMSVQVIGPYLEDRTTIAFSKMIGGLT